ncbi:hypothetical protein EYR36_010448 [Pleurotus pulmonarius]|nr:hypothetical protein EYR36_010448 [Pleurotus pulmonarius]
MEPPKIDIERVSVEDDPRAWSEIRKNVTLFIISAAAMIAGLGANIQNPAIHQMEKQLPATSSQISLSLSLFILLQGVVPLIWSAVSEIKGRKADFPPSHLGSSSVITIGAATLADIYPPAIRGTKMGIYYAAPLLGPSLGPILGGALTAGFSWRACFWFLAIFSGSSFLSFLLFFKDPWRKERSLTYQNVLREKSDERVEQNAKDDSTLTGPRVGSESAPSVKTTNDSPPEINLSLKHVNPIRPLIAVLRRPNNLIILLASGFCFAFMFLIAYATSRTLGRVYNYSPFKIGLALLSLGIGSLAGSVLGGRYSDYTFRVLKEANGGVGCPEMRLRSTILGLIFLPPSIVGMGWVYHQHAHIAFVCVMLFSNGFFLIWTYSSTLAYIVDANNGRSSTAMAANSAFRGMSAFLATEITVPLQDSLGDGPMYTIWGVIVLMSELLILLVYLKAAIQQMQEQLPATSSQISLSLSLFILSQGSAPLLWSALSEIKGRKLVYILSIGLSTVGCVVTALASNIGLVIGFRCLQGVGSSSVVSLGAATLADLYPPSIRGTKMGIYYAAPLLGPSLGPILGGVLTAGFSWRACFWFMAIFSGASFLTFLLFLKDTWRKERSLTYQNVLRTRLRELAGDEDKWVRGDGKKTSPSPDHASSVTEIAATSAGKSGLATDPMADDNHTTVAGPKSDSVPPDVPDIKLSFSDVNPIQPLWLVLRRPNNFIILLASGSLYAFGFLISYTTARTLGNMYHYNALKIGLVLLSFGLGFGWVSQQHLPIAAMCAFLFLNGFFSIWIYASTLAYILDANNGRSSTAVAANSTFRGLFAFFATEIAVPLQDAVGDGWMYTIWGMIMVATEFLIFIVIWKGGKWREQSEKREAESRFKL